MTFIRLPQTGASCIHHLGIFDRSWIATATCLFFLVGCASDTSFDRHNLSRLWLSPDGQKLYFDATVSNAYPENEPLAEQARLGWMSEWLKLRKFCTEGHEVVGRRNIRRDEYNPMRHHLRYEIECTQSK